MFRRASRFGTRFASRSLRRWRGRRDLSGWGLGAGPRRRSPSAWLWSGGWLAPTPAGACCGDQTDRRHCGALSSTQHLRRPPEVGSRETITPITASPGPTMTRLSLRGGAAWLVAALFSAAPAAAAPGDNAASAAAPGALTDNPHRTRAASLPAKGLFVGDQLSETAKTLLAELVLQALGMSVEVVLIVPTGPWEIDGGTQADNALTTARLNAVKRFLVERGVPARHLYVESRIDQKVREPRLDVQFYGRPAED